MPLVKSAFIPIPPGPRPGFDHADIYRDSSGASRLYVAHTGADRVDVIDCQAGAYLRALPGHPGVAGVLIDSGQDLLFTSDREAAQVGVYRCSDEKLLARLNVGAHPNGLAFDPGRRRLFCFNLGEPIGENCTASVSDIGQPEVITTIRLPGRPRWAVYDPRHRSGLREDPRPGPDPGHRRRLTDNYPHHRRAGSGPAWAWIDGERLFCAADGQALVVMDRDTGAIEAVLPLPGSPDVVMHDPGLRLLYVAVGDSGVIYVADTASLAIRETVPTESGAHTIGIDPDRHAVYAFLPGSSGAAVYTDY